MSSPNAICTNIFAPRVSGGEAKLPPCMQRDMQMNPSEYRRLVRENER